MPVHSLDQQGKSGWLKWKSGASPASLPPVRCPSAKILTPCGVSGAAQWPIVSLGSFQVLMCAALSEWTEKENYSVFINFRNIQNNTKQIPYKHMKQQFEPWKENKSVWFGEGGKWVPSSFVLKWFDKTVKYSGLQMIKKTNGLILMCLNFLCLSLEPGDEGRMNYLICNYSDFFSII